MMKKGVCFIALIMVFVMAFSFSGCTSSEDAINWEKDMGKAAVEQAEAYNVSGKNPVVTMVIKDYGTIKLELYPTKAPQSVYNFISLANSDYYNGLIFHRIISGFMVQGGDPEGTGGGGPGYNIKGEFSGNRFGYNDIKHERGVLSMARSQTADSAGSQFFIMHGKNAGLDTKYAAFGRVLEGIEIVDEMVKVPVSDDNGTVADRSQAPVIESITVETFGDVYPEPIKLDDSKDFLH